MKNVRSCVVEQFLSQTCQSITETSMKKLLWRCDGMGEEGGRGKEEKKKEFLHEE